MLNKHCIGRFEISDVIIRSIGGDEPEERIITKALVTFMAGGFILSVHRGFPNGHTSYVMISNRFRPVNPGGSPPLYQLTIRADGSGIIVEEVDTPIDTITLHPPDDVWRRIGPMDNPVAEPMADHRVDPLAGLTLGGPMPPIETWTLDVDADMNRQAGAWEAAITAFARHQRQGMTNTQQWRTNENTGGNGLTPRPVEFIQQPPLNGGQFQFTMPEWLRIIPGPPADDAGTGGEPGRGDR